VAEKYDSHLVITVHGIRTFGNWQERLETLVSSQSKTDEVEFFNYKYNYFSVIAFILPFSRWIVTQRFKRELLALCSGRQKVRIDLVAHSFGTHLVGWALWALRKEKISFHTVILAGSVLRGGFPWRDLMGQNVIRVINDCGSRDNVLLLSQFWVLFTGMAGRTGFSGATNRSFRNRFSTFGHSGYFDGNDYMKDRWLKLLMEEMPIETFDNRPPPGLLDGIAIVLANNAEPFKLIVYALPFVGLAAWMIAQRDAALASALLAQSQLVRVHSSSGQIEVIKKAIIAETLSPSLEARSLAMAELRLLPKRLTLRPVPSQKSNSSISGTVAALRDPTAVVLIGIDKDEIAVAKWRSDNSSKDVEFITTFLDNSRPPYMFSKWAGGIIAAVAIDNVVSLFDAVSGWTSTFGVGFTPVVFSASSDGKFFAFSDGSEVAVYTSTGAPVGERFSFSSLDELVMGTDGRFLLALSDGRTVEEIDLQLGTRIVLLADRQIGSIAAADTVRRYAALGAGGVHVFYGTGSFFTVPNSESGGVGRLAFDPTGRFLAHGSHGARVTDVTTGQDVARIDSSLEIYALTFNSTSSTLILAGTLNNPFVSGNIEIWDLQSAPAYRDARTNFSSINGIRYNDRNTLLTADFDLDDQKTITLTSRRSDLSIISDAKFESKGVFRFSFSKHQDRLFVQQQNRVERWSWPDLHKLDSSPLEPGWMLLEEPPFHPRATALLTNLIDNEMPFSKIPKREIELRDIESKVPVANFTVPEGSVGLAISRFGRYAIYAHPGAAGGSKPRMAILDAKKHTVTEINLLGTESKFLFDVAFGGNDQIAVVRDGSFIYSVDLPSKRSRRIPIDLQNYISEPSVSADGTMFAACGENEINIFNTSGTQIVRVDGIPNCGHDYSPELLWIGNDLLIHGTGIANDMQDKTFRIDNPSGLVDDACGWLREFTGEEGQFSEISGRSVEACSTYWHRFTRLLKPYVQFIGSAGAPHSHGPGYAGVARSQKPEVAVPSE
jgi:hypothetical protein